MYIDDLITSNNEKRRNSCVINPSAAAAIGVEYF